MPNGTPKDSRGLATSACAPKLNAIHDLVGPNDRLLRVKPFQFSENSTETANNRWASRSALPSEFLNHKLKQINSRLDQVQADYEAEGCY